MIHILVLEDDLMVQNAWRWMLAALGESRIVYCPAEARRVLAAGFRPDIIFSDWEMPGETGGDFCASLRVQGDTTPVVVVSGLDRSVTGQAAGVTAYLLKPFTLGAVERAIATWVRRRPSSARLPVATSVSSRT